MDDRNSLLSSFKNKKVLVVGLGIQGGGAGIASFFSKRGSFVKVTDLKIKKDLQESIDKLKDLSIEYTLGEHKLEDFLGADYIFKGPSVPWDMPNLIEAQKKGIPIDMESSFVVSLLKSKVIGVTGTRGKSTTSQLIYETLKKINKNIFIGGNISGVSTIDILNHAKEDDIVVLELSSWSLSGFHRKKISPHIAVFTNFYPDHLNYYKSIDDYLYDKKAIYLYQKRGDYCLINNDIKDKIDLNEIKSYKIFYKKGNINIKFKYIKGEHNLENAVAALEVSRLFDIDRKNAIEIIENFKGLPYRQQIIKIKNNITFINDSTSTTPTSLFKAIQTFSDKPIILIFGGNNKNLPLDDILEKLKNITKIIFTRGTLTDTIYPLLKKEYKNKVSIIFSDLEQAVFGAYKEALSIHEPCYVLFSPGATSFSMFKNEFDRGDAFNKIVNKI